MKFLYFLILLSISALYASEDQSNKVNIENMKILRKSVNFAYKLGNDFLDVVRGGSPLHESLKKLTDITEKRNFKLNDFLQISMPFIGYIILLTIGLLFAILMPIVGFCFCICRCAGKCGGKVKGMDPKHATCKRYTYAFLLGMISVIMLAGIVLAFINNQLIHDILTNSNEEINTLKQISASSKIMNTSLDTIDQEIDKAGKSRNKQEFKNSDSIINTGLIQNFVDYLEKNKEAKNSGVNEISENLSKMSSWNELKTHIENLKVSTISDYYHSFLQQFNTNFKALVDLLQKNVNTEDTGKKLKLTVKVYRDHILKNFDMANGYLDNNLKVEYLEYRMYICIGICCLLLLIVLFYFLGLCFGQCGERPFEDARICNRGVGANLMMAGVAFAFLFTPIIIISEIVLFLGGGLMQTEVCRYLTNSYEPGVKVSDSLIDVFMNFSRNPKKPIFYNTFDTLINRCPKLPMAEAFNLESNLSNSITTEISNIANKIKSVAEENQKNFTEILKNMKDGPNIDIPYIKGIISSKILSSCILKYFEPTQSTNEFVSAITRQSKIVLNKIEFANYSHVNCSGMHNATKTLIDAVCVTFLWPFNGFWYGVGICLVFTIPAIIFAVKLAGLYRHTEKYSADYEEPDYHSYMGFYTNNADNIPMKKSKSGKNNQKNRNSNYSNKDSLKQTNPQYLPVYPYDAYE